MANNTEMINKMYDSQLAGNNEQLKNNYNQAVAGVNEQQISSQKAADANLNRTAVENQKAQRNYNEVKNAYGLTSGAMAQARMASDNQLQADMTSIRSQQQANNDALERQKQQLGDSYRSAILQAQSSNNADRAKMLYQQAQQDEAVMRAEKQRQEDIARADLQRSEDIARQQNENNAKLARTQIEYLLANGIRPSDALIASSGYDSSYIDNALGIYQRNNAPASVSSSGGYGGGGDQTLKPAIDLDALYGGSDNRNTKTPVGDSASAPTANGSNRVSAINYLEDPRFKGQTSTNNTALNFTGRSGKF